MNMKSLLAFGLVLAIAAPALAAGQAVTYQVDGASYEGYFTSPSPTVSRV